MIYLQFLNGIIFISLHVTLLDAGESLEFIEFHNWARRMSLDPTKIENKLLPPFVMLASTITNECFSVEECIDQLNSEEMSRTIPHFYIGGDGRIYVGHGWDLRGPESLCDVDMSKPMIEISFIGDFGVLMIPSIQLKAAKKLLEHGLMAGKLSETYKLFGDWQIIDELVPFYDSSNFEIFKTWPHWTDNLDNCTLKLDNFFP